LDLALSEEQLVLDDLYRQVQIIPQAAHETALLEPLDGREVGKLGRESSVSGSEVGGDGESKVFFSSSVRVPAMNISSSSQVRVTYSRASRFSSVIGFG